MSANLPKQSKADIERIKARTLNIKALNYLSVKKKIQTSNKETERTK
jgi:hypothetical protein